MNCHCRGGPHAPTFMECTAKNLMDMLTCPENKRTQALVHVHYRTYSHQRQRASKQTLEFSSWEYLQVDTIQAHLSPFAMPEESQESMGYAWQSMHAHSTAHICCQPNSSSQATHPASSRAPIYTAVGMLLTHQVTITKLSKPSNKSPAIRYKAQAAL